MGSTAFFCPCSEAIHLGQKPDEESLRLETFPTTIANHHTPHSRSQLSYCQHCNALKCRKCIEVEIVCRFCPRCMKEMKPDQVSCTRNCFDCPLCGMNVDVTLDQEKRIYFLSCNTCEWKWDTGVLDKKPRSLYRIVKGLMAEREEVMSFGKLQQVNLQRKQSEIEKMGLDREFLLEFEALKVKNGLKNNDIYTFLEKNAIRDYDPATEKTEALSNLRSNITILPYDRAIKQAIVATPPFPIPTKLRTKSSKRCKACRTSLMKPDIDPFSTKFYKLSNATDTLPAIEIKAYPKSPSVSSSTRYLLVMKNPLDVPMNVNLSSSTTTLEFPHKLNLPISKFKIGTKPENSNKVDILVKTIPYIELTKSTKISRVELMNRQQPNFNDFENIVEQKHNFVVLPIKIFKSGESSGELRIPLFVSVSTDLFSTGFWCILKFDE